MSTTIIGRKDELNTLQILSESSKSEFLAVYGRRRVGKTFLIHEAFDGKFDFHVTGIANASMKQQLSNFTIALKKYNNAKTSAEAPADWLTAFVELENQLEQIKGKKKKIIFIDELPWFDTPRSGFISALEHFWNSWASARKDILLIVCGSAASWMINKLIRNTGGLYNRVTQRIQLEPFTLQESELFLKSKGARYERYDLLQLYMTMGGIPYYLDQVDVNKSIAQNTDNLFFRPNGLLHTEFDQLYRSLFKNSEKYISIIEALAKKAKGLTREELFISAGLANSGGTTQLIKELEESGFIRKYLPFGKKQRNSLYQLIDFYSLFYLRFIKGNYSPDTNHWLNSLDDPKQRTWAGYAFEQICFAHIQQIKQALGIASVQTGTSSWIGEGAQIDLVIDRRDRVINLCEMKYSVKRFTIDKKYHSELQKKIQIFKEATDTGKSVFLTMITALGINRNTYSDNLVQQEVTIADLFAS